MLASTARVESGSMLVMFANALKAGQSVPPKRAPLSRHCLERGAVVQMLSRNDAKQSIQFNLKVVA